MAESDLEEVLEGLVQGESVEIQLANGDAVTGVVDSARGSDVEVDPRDGLTDSYTLRKTSEPKVWRQWWDDSECEPQDELVGTAVAVHVAETDGGQSGVVAREDDHDGRDSPRVLTVVSCGESKQDLDDGETVPARELYTGSPHVCKDTYGQHSHGYYIASAKFGLVHNQKDLPEYDKTLANMSDAEVAAWAEEVADLLADLVVDEDYDAVVIIGGRDYVEPLRDHFDRLDAAVLTPWQTNEDVTGVGLGMSWCNEQANWPVNVTDFEEIGEVVST